uniref:Uncharacterized protein n=1 Tax=viral metagenome TaxID=1070528 RepID=A0A6C0JW09_9ZZZZ
MKKIREDVPANTIGAGNIAGAGVGQNGEPGINKKRKIQPFLSFVRRKLPTS